MIVLLLNGPERQVAQAAWKLIDKYQVLPDAKTSDEEVPGYTIWQYQVEDIDTANDYINLIKVAGISLLWSMVGATGNAQMPNA